MCDGQFVRGQAIERQQQPATQLLLHRMIAVAHCSLGHLCQQRLGVTQQQILQCAGTAAADTIEFIPAYSAISGGNRIRPSARWHGRGWCCRP